MDRITWTAALFSLLLVMGPASADEEGLDETGAGKTAPDEADLVKRGPAAEDPVAHEPAPEEAPAPARPALFERSADLAGHTNLVRGLAFDGTGRTLATCGADRSLRLWSVRTAKAKSSIVLPRAGRGP